MFSLSSTRPPLSGVGKTLAEQTLAELLVSSGFVSFVADLAESFLNELQGCVCLKLLDPMCQTSIVRNV